ncbi:MAG: FAD:protein FMN transferase [Rhodococcus sp. (in: high G+C Gram-positive bacteria)]
MITVQFSTRAWVQQVMGLPISVHVRADDTERSDIAHAVDDVFATLRRADDTFSTWRADSELMQLRQGRLTRASEWMHRVQSLCSTAALATDGLFTTDLVGPDGTRAFDPTGLVKAWAVTEAAASLRDIDNLAFSINAGGDILCGSTSPEQFPAWRIGIEDPADRSTIASVVEVSEGAVATSGSAARGAHIVDPRTGGTVQQSFSTTITGPSLLWADIWATTTFIDPTALDGRGEWSDYRLTVTCPRR